MCVFVCVCVVIDSEELHKNVVDHINIIYLILYPHLVNVTF